MLDYWKDYPNLQQKLVLVQDLMADRLAIQNKEIESAIQTFSTKGGKLIRPALFFLFAEIAHGKVSDEKFVKIAASLELLHSATLVHDDIIDDSPTRRALPTIQSQFGKDIAVYTGDFIYTIYFELLAETMAGTPFLLKNAKSMKKILQGELHQMSLTYQKEQTIWQYLKSINGKTAELISLSCWEGTYFGGADFATQARAKRIGKAIGLAFQVYDDILNFSLDLGSDEKPILTDVVQGIYTYPLLAAKTNAPEKINPYLIHPENLSIKERTELAELVAETGGLEDALSFAEKLTEKAIREIDLLPESDSKETLKSITVDLLHRAY